MKRIIVLLLFATLSGFAVQAQIVKSYEKPDEKEFKAAVKQVLKNTTCMAKDTVARLEALNVIQREINNFPAEDWKDFVFNNWNWKDIDNKEHHGVLYFYRQAFNKVRREVRSTKVAEGTVVLWNVYNMGYIVKTPTHTFGIDVAYRGNSQGTGLYADYSQA